MIWGHEKKISGEKVDSYKIGISTPTFYSADLFFTKKLNPFQALWAGMKKTYEISKFTIIVVKKLIQGDVSKDTLGGPIMIAQMAGDQAREGTSNFIFFIALLSINLGILNLLPIPVLDGGHILFFSIEAAIRRPVSIKVREIAQQGGLIVLLIVMIFVCYNDISRLIFS